MRMAQMMWGAGHLLFVPTVLMLLGRGDTVDSAVAGNIGLFFASWGLLVPLHELVHAVTARAVGLGPARVHLGGPPWLVRATLSGVALRVGPPQLTSFTLVAPPASDRGVRLRHAVVSAAPFLLQAAALVAIVIWLSPAGTWSVVRDGDARRELQPLTMLAYANAWMVALSLVPRDPSDLRNVLVARHVTRDGLHLAAELHAIAELVDTQALDEAVARARALHVRFPDTPAAVNALACALLERGQIADARELLGAALDAGVPDDADGLNLRNTAAWAHLLADEAAAALTLAEEVVALLRVPYARGTLGAALVANGCIDEGLGNLTFAYERSEERALRAHNAAWIAVAHARAGRLDEARAWLERARSLHPGCQSLPVAEREVERATVEA